MHGCFVEIAPAGRFWQPFCHHYPSVTGKSWDRTVLCSRFFWLKRSSAPYVMTSTVTSIVPAWCSRAQKGWSGTINKKLHEAEWHNVAGGCNLVFFFGVTHLQNNWIGVYVAVLFANFRKTLLLQLLSSLFFGGYWLQRPIFVDTWWAKSSPLQPSRFCSSFVTCSCKWLKIRDLQNA